MEKFEFTLRAVREEDAEDLLRWRNHPEIRKFFFHSQPVSREEHWQWFQRKIHDPHTTMYMASSEQGKLGTIRYEAEEKGIYVSVMINPDFLGRGLGTRIIRFGTEQFIREYKPNKAIFAEIKPENIASIKAFQKAGFQESHITFFFRANMQNSLIHIDEKTTIGGQKTFIIAEIGSNHAQDVHLAYETIDAAVECGADAVKFQSLQLDELYHQPSQEIRELHRKIDLEESWHAELHAYCVKKGILFFSAPTYLRAVDILEELDVKLYKLASAQIGTFPQIIEKVAATGKPILLSTGIVSYSELERAIKLCDSHQNNKVVVLHCNSIYPTPYDKVHLPLMNLYRAMFGCLVGYSDHTSDIYVSLAAVALGANVIERHFTLSKDLPVPDAPISLEPSDFKRMVEGIRAIEQSLTESSRFEIEQEERRFKKGIRYRVFLNVAKKRGDHFQENDFVFKRYSQGIDCRDIEYILQYMQAKEPLAQGTLLQWRMLEGK